jgi:hypothetical protein
VEEARLCSAKFTSIVSFTGCHEENERQEGKQAEGPQGGQQAQG